MPKINVKWGTNLLNVDANLDESPLLFKAQLFELTDIPPDRQKLLVKGKTIGDDSWNGLTLKDGSTVMLIGGKGSTTDSLSAKNVADDVGKATKKELVLPVGLQNLGNTCYMNSTLQCFKVIPELQNALKKYNVPLASLNSNVAPRAKMLTSMLKNLYDEMERKRIEVAANPSGEHDDLEITPLFFLHILHQTFPQFATRDERGQFQQQDANECFCEVLRVLTDETVYSAADQAPDKQQSITLKKFFEIENDVTIKCVEEEGRSEPEQKSVEKCSQLSCFLSQDVRYIQLGIKNKMIEEIEKHSTLLGRNARYEKASLITRLPAYLSVQIVRFYYKEREKVNAKILKDVKFPIVLDVFEMCTPVLQEKLKPARQALKDYDDTKLEKQKQAKLAEADAPKIDLKPKGFLPNYFADDPGSNNSGIYELKALITHKGRASNQGHYVAWVRVADDDDDPETVKWAACDDDNVYLVSEDEILKLSGGGDWHCAYVLLYGPKKIPIL